MSYPSSTSRKTILTSLKIKPTSPLQNSNSSKNIVSTQEVENTVNSRLVFKHKIVNTKWIDRNVSNS